LPLHIDFAASHLLRHERTLVCQNVYSASSHRD
jgi:hypothetical protein